jgi:hypothetical protein
LYAHMNKRKKFKKFKKKKQLFLLISNSIHRDIKDFIN